MNLGKAKKRISQEERITNLRVLMGRIAVENVN
jgi:hypothetical protein